MTSQSKKKTIAIHILLNISRSKSNQTLKFGQLLEHNTRNIFLEKSYTKFGVKISPRLSSEKPHWAYTLFNSLKFYTVCFYCMPS